MTEPEPKPAENQLRGNAYVGKAAPGQQVQFSGSGTSYIVQQNGSIRRSVPKQSKKQRRNLRREQP